MDANIMIRLTSMAILACASASAQANLGVFEGQGDVGSVLHAGSAEFDKAARSYTLAGSGENMWAASDEFHFVWKKVSARDLTLTATIAVLGDGGNNHRKGVLMIRQSLDGDSAYVDAARHGDGLTSLQFRDAKGAITREIESNVSGPARLRLEKQGDTFYMWIGGENEELQFSGGAARVEIRPPFYVGIGVCAHAKDAVEKAVFTNVDLITKVAHPKAEYSTVETVLVSGDARTGYVARKRLTAPGWSPDGRSLTFEADGQRQDVPFIPLKTAAPPGAAVTAPSDFTYSAAEHNGRMQIFRTSPSAPAPEQLTTDDTNNVSPYPSPDGKYLLFLSDSKDLKAGELLLRLMTLASKTVKTLTIFRGDKGSFGMQPWSPDGRRIVFISYQSME